MAPPALRPGERPTSHAEEPRSERKRSCNFLLRESHDRSPMCRAGDKAVPLEVLQPANWSDDFHPSRININRKLPLPQESKPNK